MKKISGFLIFLLFFCSTFAQSINDFYDECVEPEEKEFAQRFLWNSENGYWFPTKGTYRMLVIFINVIYDVTPTLDPNYINPNWPVLGIEGINQLPPYQYFNDVFDVNNALPRTGFFTRFMSECSHDSLVLLADFTSLEIKGRS